MISFKDLMKKSQGEGNGQQTASASIPVGTDNNSPKASDAGQHVYVSRPSGNSGLRAAIESAKPGQGTGFRFRGSVRQSGVASAASVSSTAAPPQVRAVPGGDKAVLPAGVEADLGSRQEQAPPAVISAADYQHESQPDGMAPSDVQALRDAVELVRDNLDNPGMVSQALVSLMRMAQEDEHLRDMMSDDDIGVMVAGLRSSTYTMVQIKTEKAEKRRASKQEVDEVLDAMMNAGIRL